jgi:uncharacterized protein YcbK (DUF882 family)
MDHPARRTLIRRAAVLCAPALLIPRRSLATVLRADALAFVHTHTGETLSVDWRVEGMPDPAALRRVDRLLRDTRSGDVHPIDPALLDQLQRVSRLLGTREPFQVISGFRSPRTNETLRRTGGGGVARASLHLEGRAIDVRLADVPLATLRDAALELGAGGVGYYARERFVHLDTGRVRTW